MMTPPEKEQEILKKPVRDFRGVELTGLEQAVVSLAEGCIDTAEKLRIAVDALKSIDEFGHGAGHGRGWTCGCWAQEALAKIEGEKNDT